MNFSVIPKNVVWSVLLAFVVGTSTAEEQNDCPDWWIIHSIYLDFDQFTWQSIANLRALAQPCVGDESYRTLAVYLATLEGKIGNHQSGLLWMDRFHANKSREANTLPDFKAKNAIPYILDRAKNHRIVVTNERHHASSDRLLPLHLLESLYDQGFRYLAVETLSNDHTINKLGYATLYDGYYSNDVVYAQLLRSARELGFEIVAYERERDQVALEDPENPINRSSERDRLQAKNIISRIFDKDPDAKVLIHCGYGHVNEEMLSRSTPMTRFLKDMTGRDPLSISQVNFSERHSSDQESPWRRQAANQGFLSDHPIVLVDSHDNLIDFRTGVDIEVVGLKTKYENGRPFWMRMGGIRSPKIIETPECLSRSCVVEVFDPTEDEHAVPYDRLEIERSNNATVYVPSVDSLKLRIMDLNGNILVERPIGEVQTLDPTSLDG